MSFGEVFAAVFELWLDGVIASVVAGLVLPLVGALVLLRRQVFLGVAVPQFSTAGLALGLLILPWFPRLYEDHLDHGHPPMLYALLFAAAGAGLALVGFAWLQARDPRGSSEGRLAGGYALATALGLVFLAKAPVGESYIRGLLEGERVLLLDHHDLTAVVTVFGLVLAVLVVLRRGLLLVAFDPDAAIAQGLRVSRYERVELLVVGLAIGGGVMTVGPVLVFGLLFLPPLGARQWAGNMRGFLLGTAMLGILATVAAWPLSIWWDLPYGPSTVLVAAFLVFVSWSLARMSERKA